MCVCVRDAPPTPLNRSGHGTFQKQKCVNKCTCSRMFQTRSFGRVAACASPNWFSIKPFVLHCHSPSSTIVSFRLSLPPRLTGSSMHTERDCSSCSRMSAAFSVGTRSSERLSSRESCASLSVRSISSHQSADPDSFRMPFWLCCR